MKSPRPWSIETVRLEGGIDPDIHEGLMIIDAEGERVCMLFEHCGHSFARFPNDEQNARLIIKAASRAAIKQCLHCGVRFEAGRGAGRRADAKFCSEEHKIAYHSLARSRGGG